MLYKSIAYAYPTSHNAAELGFSKTGCYHISMTQTQIEGSDQCATYLPPFAEGFATANNPDLIVLFKEYDCDILPSFEHYGNADALAALKSA